MRPLSLSIEGLRSFRSKVEIGFDGRDHVAIIGDTGAGKSTILEALTYALYGRTTYSGRGYQDELMNDTSTSLRVVLRFTVSQQIWQVTRTLRRAGDRSVGQANASLIRYDEGDEPIDQVESVRRVNERVVELIGLDAEAFLRTVILPQGQFAQLLVDDDPRERSKILQQVWRTDELVRVGSIADEARAELRPLLSRVEQALEGEPEAPKGHLAALEDEARRLAEVATKAQRRRADAVAAREQVASTQQTLQVAASIAEQLHRFDAETSLQQARHIAQATDAIRRAKGEVVTQRQEISAELGEIPGDDDGLTRTDLGAAGRTLEALPQLADAAITDAREARAAVKAAQDASAEAERLAQDAGEARRAVDGRREDQRDLEGQVKDARDRRDRAAELLRKARQAATDASEGTQQAERLRRTAADERERAEDLIRQHADAKAKADQARALLHEAQRLNAAASAAHGFHEGDPCPVCDRNLPHNWQRPIAAGLDEAPEAVRTADEEAQRLDRDATAAATRAEGAGRQATQHAELSRSRQQATDELTARLAAVVAVDVVEITNARLLDPLDDALHVAEETLRVHVDETSTLAQKAASAEADARGAASAVQERREAADRTALRAREKVSEMRKAVASLSPALGCDLTLPNDALELHDIDLASLALAEQRIADRRQVLDARERQREELRACLDQTAQELADLEQRWQAEVIEPAGDFAQTLNGHRDALSKACVRLELDGVMLPEVAAGVDPSMLVELVQSTRACTGIVSERIEQRTTEASREAREARTTLDRVADEVGLEAGAAEVDIAERAVDAHQNAEYDTRKAAEDAQRFERRVQPLIELRYIKSQLEGKTHAIGDLAAALKPAAFPKWLTLRRSRNLLIYASQLLEQMTGGRYSYADLTDEHAEWRVIDKDSGLPRSPASLSGGEKFIASLSLALGMVGMMARSGGRLESLWLDEGFGALDRSNLDAAVDALTTVASGGRLVAVISHVRAVAEQVEHVLTVTRGVTGSKVRWLNASERREVGEPDIDNEVGMALSGLVE